MEQLVKGFLKFRTEVFGKKKALFTRLSKNQTPRALFITCSDSRVDPTLLTQTDPGELFILRNAGNMVPPCGSMQGGSAATIAYSQLDYLRTQPSVAQLLRQKKVDLHGWVYSISTGDVWVYDFTSEQFTSLLDDAVPRLKVAR